MRASVPAALVLVLAAPLPSLPATGRPPAYAIVNARVVTVSGPVHDRATIVLRDGLIEAVGPSVAVPRDARVLDAQGLVVTPGLFDGFSGAGLPAAAPRAPGGSGGGPPSGSPTPAPLSPQSLVLDRIRAADLAKTRDQGITTALVVPREGVLPGRSTLINLAGDRPEAMAVKHPAALHLHMSTIARQYPGSLMGTVAYARQALADAAHYRDRWAAYEKSPRGQRRPRYDAALAAWQDVLAGGQPLVVTAPRENDIRRALALQDEFKVKVVAAGALQASRVAELVKARKLPLLVSVNYDPPAAASFFGAVDEEKERRDIADAERNPFALHQAGVPFALVSAHAPDFLAGVRKAIEQGLPREAALRAVTLAPAEALGVADRLGSLEPGKIANLVAWTAEPLTKDARAKMVFVDGELFEPEPPAKGGEGSAADPTAGAKKPEGAPSANQPRERQAEEVAPEKRPGPEAPLPGAAPEVPVIQPSPSPSPRLPEARR